MHGGVGGIGDIRIAENISIEATGFDTIDTIFGGPVSFLVSDKKCAVLIDADAIGGAESVGDDVGAFSVGADAKERAVVRDEGG